jgi:hypothetical protein
MSLIFTKTLFFNFIYVIIYESIEGDRAYFNRLGKSMLAHSEMNVVFVPREKIT